ncbi:MAG TPA: prepilin-type N-terminal cleavage/methylation domain-containing protein [Pyrinomonadaceae bacterium]|nr:prepilin-type N-terminal cleavage/methylation domain-containing protein [Pyrinomonadaceae bacterium]
MNYSRETKARESGHRRSEAGFSLMELLAAMIIFMVVSGSIYGVLQVARQSRGAVSNKVQLTKNARLGLNLVGRDIYNSGYGYPLLHSVVIRNGRVAPLLGIPADPDPTRDLVPPIIAGNNITLNTFNQTPNIRTDQVTFLFKDSTFNLVGTGNSAVSQPLNINAATTTGTGIDEIVPISGSNANCRVNDLYLITGNNGSTLSVATGLSGTNKIQFANGDPLGFNLTGATGVLRNITTPATIIRVRMITYFVTADGTLVRREYVNQPPPSVAAFVDEPLVYGVENFQIRYILDDGAEVDNPSAGPDGIPGTADDDLASLAAVRQVRVTIAARTTELDARGQPVMINETATFSTRNLGYDAN